VALRSFPRIYGEWDEGIIWWIHVTSSDYKESSKSADYAADNDRDDCLCPSIALPARAEGWQRQGGAEFRSAGLSTRVSAMGKRDGQKP